MTHVEIAENVHWVGVVDWDLRDFHGYETRRGTTYNAYLINDHKTALVDTVKYPFKTALDENLSEVTNIEELDYVVVNHVEMDHSSSLTHIMQKAKNATIVTSRRGKAGLTKYYGDNSWDFRVVGTGDEIDLGSRTLQFVEAPMLHWPDSMFTYLKEDRILMPNDAFGQHLAASHRFDDEVDQSILMNEAAKYFANILMPLASLILKKIDEITKLSVEPRTIAPSHGVIWRKDPGKIVNAYLEWSRGKTENKVVVVYDTMWGSTQKMAYAITEAIADRGIDVHLLQLRRSDSADIMKEILDAKAVLVGSPTLRNTMFPTIAAFLNYATGLKPKGKLWAAFGSYGWGGGAVRDINEQLKQAKFEILEPGLQIQYRPTKEELLKCRKLSETIVGKIQL